MAPFSPTCSSEICALADRDQEDAVERQLLVESRHVFLVAGQAVEAFGDDDVELLPPGVLQAAPDSPHAGARPRLRRDRNRRAASDQPSASIRLRQTRTWSSIEASR